MFNPRQGGSASPGLVGVLAPLASIAALLLTVFLGPQVWPMIEADTVAQLRNLYSGQVAFVLGWCIHILIYPLVFILIRLTLMAALSAISVYATNRLI